MKDIIRIAVSCGYSITIGPAVANTEPARQYKRLVTIMRDDDLMFISVPSYGNMDIVIRNAFHKERPDHPVYVALKQERGSMMECIMTESLIENAGELVHTALRKLCDSEATSLLYNAIHHLPPPVWAHIVKETKLILTDVMTKRHNRFQLGQRIKNIWEVAIENFEQEEFNKTAQRYTFLDPRKKDEQKLAMTTFTLSCRLLSDDDWTFGVCGFLHEEKN